MVLEVLMFVSLALGTQATSSGTTGVDSLLPPIPGACTDDSLCDCPVVWLVPPDDPFATGPSSVALPNNRGALVCHARYPQDVEAVKQLLGQVEGIPDLTEPFTRVREAIGEARKMGVTGRESTRLQVELARRILAELGDRRAFLFVNVSAIHQPNAHYLGRDRDDPDTHEAALAYVDSCLPPLFAALEARGRALCIVCSDHGTCYGERGHVGHRVADPAVWTVPYAEFAVGARK